MLMTENYSNWKVLSAKTLFDSKCRPPLLAFICLLKKKKRYQIKTEKNRRSDDYFRTKTHYFLKKTRVLEA